MMSVEDFAKKLKAYRKSFESPPRGDAGRAGSRRNAGSRLEVTTH